MAHLRSIVHKCNHPGCTSRSTEALYSQRNDRHGEYCTKHARQHERQLQRLEDEMNARARDRHNQEEHQ